MEYYTVEDHKKNLDILQRAAERFESYQPFEEKNEIIMAVLMLLLDHPVVRKRVFLRFSSEVTKEIEGSLLDKICAVINKNLSDEGRKTPPSMMI
ncbi:MAG: hypothetical protein HC846_01370, partial [Blastocatellia bacterium]|nr:hypothetical protein [Blastocatellia bacterium]